MKYSASISSNVCLGLSLGVASLLGGCATSSLNYDSLSAGRFTGSVVVIWVGEGGESGDGKFLFVPDPDNPLTFRRKDPKAPGAVIRPDIMYTDGGSIPKVFQAFRGLSPWGYAPAYMIHDWLFQARYCLNDNSTDPRYTKLGNVNFEESAKIIGEAIKTLVATRKVKEDDVSASLVTSAVGTSTAEQIFKTEGKCQETVVSREHLLQAEAAVPGSARHLLARPDRPAAPEVAIPVAKVMREDPAQPERARAGLAEPERRMSPVLTRLREAGRRLKRIITRVSF